MIHTSARAVAVVLEVVAVAVAGVKPAEPAEAEIYFLLLVLRRVTSTGGGGGGGALFFAFRFSLRPCRKRTLIDYRFA